MIKNLTKTTKIMVLAVAGISFVLLLIGLAVILFFYAFEEPLPFALGVILGGVASVIKAVWSEISTIKIIDSEKKNVQGIAVLHYLGRLMLTVAVLLLAVFFRDVIGLFGVIVGIFSLRIAAFVAGKIVSDKGMAEAALNNEAEETEDAQ